MSAKDHCLSAKNVHLWTLTRYVSGHKEVHCARCYQCLDIERMLRAYVEVHGGEIQP